MEDLMLAPCGILCAECSIYKAAQDPEEAIRLAEAWRANGFENAVPEWFKCQGCREDRSLCWEEDCKIASCCEEKGLHDCSQCGEFPCEPYQEWAETPEHHQMAYQRLKDMRRQAG